MGRGWWARGSRTGPLGRLALVGALAMVAAAGSAGVALAQGPVPGPPDPAGGPVLLVGSANVVPPLDVSAVSVAPEGPAGTVEVVVGFRAPIALPPVDYRLSAVVGMPGGARTRASLVAGPDGPRGEAEVTEGELAPGATPAWRSLGSARAELSADGTSAVLAVPSPGAPGEAVWVEAELGPSFAAARRTTPYVAVEALRPEGPRPVLAPNPWLAGPPPAGDEEGQLPPAASVPGAPALSVAGDPGAPVLEVATTEPPPAEVGGVAVTRAMDLVQVGPPGGPWASVAVDRTAGTVELLGAGGVPLGAPSGPWLVGSPDPTVPGVVALDLAGLAAAAGLPPGPGGLAPDPATTLVRVTRLVETAEVPGQWSGSGATATLAWLAPAGSPGGATVPTAGPGDDGTSPVRLALAVAAVVLAVAVVAGVVVARGRGRRRGPRPPAGGEDRRAPAEVPDPRPGRSPQEALAALEAELAALDDRGG